MEKPTFTYGIKGKLISAVCMLLVAVIMVVSSTYAWFTLSTAPEVTGITTAIGANGALEIRLYTGTTPGTDVNTTWGNLVDLSSENYGLQKIVLLPSALNLDSLGAIDRANPLKFPTYGADGRPSGDLTGAITGVYNTDEFYADNDNSTGVLAVGVASGMTDRQLAFRNARSAATNAMTVATNKAYTALQNEGGTLAEIVINKVVSEKETITVEQLTSLNNIITALEDSLVQIKSAYEQQIIAIAASDAMDDAVGTTAAETLYQTVESAIAGGSITLEGIANTSKVTLGSYEYDLTGTDLLTGIVHYQGIVTDVNAARTAINPLITANTASNWTAVSGVINSLINYTTGDVKVNNVKIESGMNKQDVIDSIIGAGLKVELTLGANSGVYVDLADQCGNFTASITIPKIEANGINVADFPAVMKTASSVAKAYLQAGAEQVGGLGAPASSGGGADMPLTEFYGYILDFAFQTNAASSNLLLQTAPADRIYKDNNNETTQGGGSTMSFKATDAQTFSTEQVIGLMESIRVVFFDDTNAILGYAKLDLRNHTSSQDKGITANLYLYTETTTYTFTPTSGTPRTVYLNPADNKYYSESGFTTEVDTTGGSVTSTTTTEFIGDSTGEKATIVELGQNSPKRVSALVYLDGATLENKDVAYGTSTSVTGSMNLQFSSDANLIPMEYGDLHIADGTTTATPATPTTP